MKNISEKYASNEVSHEEKQYVTFNIEDEVYGIEVLKVHEIIGMTHVTHVPNSLPFMAGVINLRGSVVPVVDIRIKLNLEERAYDSYTVIIIVEVKDRLVGMIVDSVADVLSLPMNCIQETPHYSAKIDTDFISSIGRVDEKLIIILDVDRILTSDEMVKINTNESPQKNDKERDK